MDYSVNILNEVKKAVSGKDETLAWILTTMLARGHVLLEDMPGVGKTNMALAFSRAMGLEYGRVQFTPDVLPSDVTGFSVMDKETGTLRYQNGAVLCNLFLADELNRATSRTQSALLEAMEEGQVTVDGISHRLPEPFCVIATQNPSGASGTQLLPDSQMDRFMIRLSIGYPDSEAELEMVKSRLNGNPLETVCQAVTRDQLLSMQKAVSEVYIQEDLIRYIIELISATRSHPLIIRGASPRATLAMTSMSKSLAYILGRDYVVPQDIAAVFRQIIPHRLLLSREAGSRTDAEAEILKRILKLVPAPKV